MLSIKNALSRKIEHLIQEGNGKLTQVYRSTPLFCEKKTRIVYLFSSCENNICERKQTIK